MSSALSMIGMEKEASFDGSGVVYGRTAMGGDDSQAMTLKVASISEVDSAGDAVGADKDNFVDMYNAQGNFEDGLTYPLHSVDFSDVVFNMTAPETTTYGGIAAKHVTYSASLLNSTVSVRLESYLFQEAGTLTNYDEQVPVTNGTLKVNVEVDNWPFCTVGGDGFNRCMKIPDDNTLADVKVPHTLLVPKCQGDSAVATLQFVCVGDDRCPTLKKVWFFFGTDKIIQVFNKWEEISQPTQDNTYSYTFSTKELSDYVGLDNLTPGDSYRFYTVYGFDSTQEPQLDTKAYDYGRNQIWQCPNTIIDYNYQEGAYLDISLAMTGAADPSLVGCTTGTSGSRLRRQLADTAACSQGQVYSMGSNARLTLSSNAMLDSINNKLKSGYPKVSGGTATMRFGTFTGSLVYDPIMDFEAKSGNGGLSKGGSIAVGIVVAAVCVACAAGAMAYRRRKNKNAKAAAAVAATKAAGTAIAVKAPTASNSPLHS